MVSRLLSLSMLSVTWMLVLLMCHDSTGNRMWEYEPLSIVTESTDPTKLAIELRIERLGRGEYALSGTLEWNYDTDETTLVEAVSFRSSTGAEDDYMLLPWTIAKQTYKQYTKTHYKDIIYKNMKNCTNFPSPENTDPWPRGTYKLNKCVLNGEGMPDVLPEGYYKVIFKVSGEVDWKVSGVARLVKKINLLG